MSRYAVSYRETRGSDPGLSTGPAFPNYSFLVGPGLQTFPEVGVGPRGFPGTGIGFPSQTGAELRAAAVRASQIGFRISPAVAFSIGRALGPVALILALAALLAGLAYWARGRGWVGYDPAPECNPGDPPDCSDPVYNEYVQYSYGAATCAPCGLAIGSDWYPVGDDPCMALAVGCQSKFTGVKFAAKVMESYVRTPDAPPGMPVPRVAAQPLIDFPDPWFPDPRPLVQPIDPFSLPILDPWPEPEPLPYRDLPNRRTNPQRSPTERPVRGPEAEPQPSHRPGKAPLIPSTNPRDVPNVVPDVSPYKSPVPGPSFEPGYQDRPGLGPWPGVEGPPPWPYEEAEPGKPGKRITSDGEMQWTDWPTYPGRPGRGRRGTKEKKVKVAINGRTMRIGGGLTELIDAIESLWDAIPKRECDDAFKDSRSGPAGPVCVGNVKDCKGAKIKYDPPLHRVPRKPVFDASGKRSGTSVARNAYGRPITHPRPQDMLRDIYNHWDKIDLCSMGQNLLENEFKDQAIGRASKAASRKFTKASGRPVGPSTGPAM